MAKLGSYAILALFLAGSTLALTPSPDASCGGTTGYTCTGSSFGTCCSQFGWCGTTDAYCGTGCQSGAGTCNGAAPTTTLVTSTSTSKPATSNPASTGLTDCLGSKNVPVSWTTSGNFGQLAKAYNARLSYKPVVIVLPTTVQHVQDAVICAGKNNVKVQARSGGHSYAAFGLGGKDGSMIIDLQGFQAVSIDASNVASVGGGIRLGNLATALYNNGKRAVPHGTCPGVGIGGHFTHGGYGYDSRAWGLALDSIVALDVVLANGTAVKASSTAYPDIYYALRGAAESFGVVTIFYLKTQAAPTTVINWSFDLPNMFSSSTTATNALLHIQDFARNTSVIDRNIGFGIYLDGETFNIGGTYFGTLDNFNNKIKPELLRTLPTPSNPKIQSVDWIKSLTLLSGQSSIVEPTTGYDAHDNFFAKSLTVPSTSPLTSAGLKSYFNYMINSGPSSGGSWFSILNLYGGPDSQINAVSSTSSAYSDRSSLWVIQHYGYTSVGNLPFPSGIQPFINGLSNSLTSTMSGVAFGGYNNYVDPSLTATQAHDAYFGATTYQKLLGIKKVVDPNNLFWNPQAIGA